MNFHRGAPIQQGAGLGSMFSGLFRALMPAARTVARSAAETIGKIANNDKVQKVGKYMKMEATRSAVDSALEALEGKPVGAAAKRRLKTATKNILKASKRKMSPNSGGRGARYKRRKIEQDQVPLFDDVDDDDDVYEDEYENFLKASKRKVSPNNGGRGTKRKNAKSRTNYFKRRKVEQDQVPLLDGDYDDYEDEYDYEYNY